MVQGLDGASLESLFDRSRPVGATHELGRKLQLAIVRASVLGDASLVPRCGEYGLEQRVGAGGMGVVFRARAPDGSLVAVKVLARSAPQARARFEREAELLRQITHPRVVRYLAHGEAPELAYLVMEWLEGRDLSRRLAQSTLEPSAALAVALELARALAATHAAGILHRDLKPSNVFLVADSLEDVRLIDFGIAKQGEGERIGGGLTASGAILGSPHYMAPEQLRGEHEPRSDVYGLGATLFEMLAGRPPFVGAHLGAVLVAVGAEPPPALAALRPELAGPVDSLVRRMLAKDPRERPRDMLACVSELSDLLARRPADGVVSHLERRIDRVPPPQRALVPGTSTSRPIGRARELHLVRGVLESCVEADSAAVISVHGEAGIGKSHLLQALVAGAARWCGALGAELTKLVGCATADEQGTPLAALRALLRADVARAAPVDVARARDHLLALIEEQASGRAEDPRILADRLHLAWLDLCEVWLAQGPTLIVLDDAHAADATSLRYLARACALAGAPNAGSSAAGGRSGGALVLLFASRDDAAVRESLAKQGHIDLVRVALGSLAPRASERLAASLLEASGPVTASEVASLAGGNAAHLHALCREARESRALTVVSLADRLWDRIEALDPDARRVLRAACIVGRVFWRGAVIALVADLSEVAFDRALERLLAEGLVARAAGSRLADEQELELTSDLVHRVGYGLCTEEQLAAGHRRVAHYLASFGRGVPPALLGEHFSRAGDGRAAAEHFLRAARAALSGEDSSSFRRYCELAARSAAEPAQRLELAELRGGHDFWAGDLEGALSGLGDALRAAEPGTRAAFRLASLVITVLGQRGDNDGVAARVQEVVAGRPTDEAARSARVVALCRGLTQLESSERDVRALRAALDAEEAAALDREAQLWRLRVLGNRVAHESFDAAIAVYTEVHRHHVESGDARSAAQIGCFLGSFHVWSGSWERASDCIEGAALAARRLAAEYLQVWALYTRGKLLVEVGPSEVAAAVLDEVAAKTERSPRMRAGALTYGAINALRAGRPDRAGELARLARQTNRGTSAASASALALSLLARGRVEEAGAAVADVRPSGHVVSEFDELIRLARSEVALALRAPEAAALAEEAGAALLRRAATLADPLRRNAYLARPHLVTATLSLTERLARLRA